MIKHAKGNLLESDAQALVNTVNTVGVMGNGIALQFKRAFPENFRAYERACKQGEVRLGSMIVHKTQALHGPRFIINFPTKSHWKGSSKLEDIRSGLRSLAETVRKLNIKVIAIPPLGCGLGGLYWADVRPLIEQAFEPLQEVEVFLYAPAGAPAAAAIKTATERRRLKQDKNFRPLPVGDGDELFPNGIFEFNVTKMLAFVEGNLAKFPIEEVEVEPLRSISPETLDEKTIREADLLKPIILAEISPGHFNVIDGNHRVERAGREDMKTIAARRIGPEQHLAFLTSVRVREAYVGYWNSKLAELE